MQEIRDHPTLQLQIIVSGSHVSTAHGETWKAIKDDGNDIDAMIDMQLGDDSGVGIARSIGKGLPRLAEALGLLKPHILVVLGDRYEAHMAATAAMLMRVPLAHIHGGEATEGLIDEAIRHGITKMAHLHFVAAQPFADRVAQLGEHPDRIFVVGAPGLDNIVSMLPMETKELSESLGLLLEPPVFLVTYHPVTLSKHGRREEMDQLLQALDAFPDAAIVMTEANADMEGQVINEMLRDFASGRPDRRVVKKSLGQLRYLSTMHHASVVVGNSSSGLIEAPTVGVPTVNIGLRQQGRLRAASVIDCESNAEAIADAIRRALSDDMKRLAARRENPYGPSGASSWIADTLAETPLDGLLFKKFFDHAATESLS